MTTEGRRKQKRGTMRGWEIKDDQVTLQGWKLVWRHCSPSLIYAGVLTGHHQVMARLRSLA